MFQNLLIAVMLLFCDFIVGPFDISPTNGSEHISLFPRHSFCCCVSFPNVLRAKLSRLILSPYEQRLYLDMSA